MVFKITENILSIVSIVGLVSCVCMGTMIRAKQNKIETIRRRTDLLRYEASKNRQLTTAIFSLRTNVKTLGRDLAKARDDMAYLKTLNPAEK